MSLFVLITIIALLIVFGPKRILSTGMTILFVIILFKVLGALFSFFLPVIVIYIIWRMLTPNKPRARAQFYSFNQEDFNNYYQRANSGRAYSGNSYGSSGASPFFEDKTKYYNILGVDENSSQDEIKKAYRKMAMKHHPDKFSNAEVSEQEYNEKKFKEINEAYEKIKK